MIMAEIEGGDKERQPDDWPVVQGEHETLLEAQSVGQEQSTRTIH